MGRIVREKGTEERGQRENELITLKMSFTRFPPFMRNNMGMDGTRNGNENYVKSM